MVAMAMMRYMIRPGPAAMIRGVLQLQSVHPAFDSRAPRRTNAVWMSNPKSASPMKHSCDIRRIGVDELAPLHRQVIVADEDHTVMLRVSFSLSV